MFATQNNVEVWKSLGTQTRVFTVVLPNTYTFFVESPDEQGLTDKEPPESMLRVFSNYEDAERYALALESYHNQYFEVVSVGLNELFESFERLSNFSKSQYGCPIRYEMCIMPEEEHPRGILCLRSGYELRH